jgi:uncharacterized protein (DUF362 family)
LYGKKPKKDNGLVQIRHDERNNKPMKRHSPLASISLDRRSFLKLAAGTAAAGGLAGILPPSRSQAAPRDAGPNGRKGLGVKGKYDLVVVKGEDPAANVRKAVDEMGGMKRFVRKGATVVVKPNMAWDRTPEQAGNTNPAVVAELVAMCFEAGAKKVNVFDRTCEDKKRCYDVSGIRAAAEAKGARVYFVEDWMEVKAKFTKKAAMSDWPVFRDAIECDTFINAPVLKHHGLANLTLSMKNLMGICLGNRGNIHQDIGNKLVDLAMFIKPDLTVIDAYRMLMAHGPQGGNLDDVKMPKTVAVGTDPTLCDTWAAKFWGIDPMEVPNIAAAAARKFGSTNLGKAKVRELTA